MSDERQALGALVERLLDEHWPDNRVNGWYLADRLLECGVRLLPDERGAQ